MKKHNYRFTNGAMATFTNRAQARPPCKWFVNCPRTATGTTPHPVLGEVPTCDPCHQFATGKKRCQATTAK